MSLKEQNILMRIFSILLTIIVTIVFVPVLIMAGNVEPTTSSAGTIETSGGVEITKATVQKTYENSSLYFIQNEGQIDKEVRYYEKGNGHTTFFTDDGSYLNLIKTQKSQQSMAGTERPENSSVKSELIKLS